MTKLYVIHDDVMDVDTFCFLQNTDGSAGSYFYNWALLQQHRNFSLYTIGSVGYSEASNVYEIDNIDRKFMVKMPEGDIDD